MTRLAVEQLKPVNGLHKLCKWIEDRGLKRAAVTNAPRENAELMISILGLSNFFELLVVGSECERAKPFPDPYLKGLQGIKASPNHTFVFEVCLQSPNVLVFFFLFSRQLIHLSWMPQNLLFWKIPVLIFLYACKLTVGGYSSQGDGCIIPHPCWEFLDQ